MLLGPKAVSLFAIGALLLVATGCGRSDSADPTPTRIEPAPSVAAPPTPTPVNPEAALRRSGGGDEGAGGVPLPAPPRDWRPGAAAQLFLSAYCFTNPPGRGFMGHAQNKG